MENKEKYQAPYLYTIIEKLWMITFFKPENLFIRWNVNLFHCANSPALDQTYTYDDHDHTYELDRSKVFIEKKPSHDRSSDGCKVQ